MNYPIYSTPKTFYVYAYPFADTTGGGLVNGSWWKDCQLRIDSVNNNLLSGSYFMEITTARQGWSIDEWGCGTTWGAYQNSNYSLVINCYDAGGNLLGYVIPAACDHHVIYNVDRRPSDNKVYNWRNGDIGGTSTYEPWVVRYASDTGANVYTPTTRYTNTPAIYRYNNRGDSRVARTQLINNGWQDFSVTLLEGTAQIGIDVQCWANTTLRCTVTLYSGQTEPIIIETFSKISRKPRGSSSWSRDVGIWYRKKNTSTWERKYLYKRNANSSTWTKI